MNSVGRWENEQKSHTMNPYFRDSFLEDPWKNLRSDRNLKSSEELHLSQESMMAGKDFSSKRTLIGMFVHLRVNNFAC